MFKTLAAGVFALSIAVATNSVWGCERFLLGRGSAPMLKSANIYFPYFKSITNFDPHVIHTADTAVLGQNLYSRLLTLDDDGQVAGDLADDISWNGKSYVIHIRKSAKTIDGKSIGPRDVVVSLKRILMLNQTTHGSLRPFLKENGIEEMGENVILTPLNPSSKSFLINTLASIDFSIVPVGSMDMDKEGWPIKDWRNTSGIYYVAEDDPDGRLVLKINSSHHFYTGKQPEVLKLFPGLGQDAVEAFNSGKVDIIPTITIASGADFLNVSDDANIFRSEPIYLTAIRSTTKGIKSLTAEERLKASLLIKKALLQKLKPGDGIEVQEFFPGFSEGMLEDDQKQILIEHLKNAESASLSRVITFGVYPSKLEYFKEALRDTPEIQVVATKGVPPWLEPEPRQTDLYYSVTDSGFYESLSLLYYNIDQSGFMDRGSGLIWLDSYINEPEKTKRIERLKALHLNFLIEGRVVPVSATSYVSVTRKPIKPSFSKFYAGTPLWKLTID